jgi:aromatic ring-cleaving dioxygenase
LSEQQSAKSEISRIASYHAHVYFRTAEERARAEQLRAAVAERFSVQLGRWHDRLIGPHAAPMYQIAFAKEVFPVFAAWLMLNRNDLAILLHPNTGQPRRDHQVNALWYGEVLPIMNPEKLPEFSDEEEIVTPNTTPAL